MNLVINASEALGDTGGTISVTTGIMAGDSSDMKDVWLDENLREGEYVFLEVADTGCGMDRETMEKIFDPFFTTKFTGRGLGMAAVLGIVRGHKGAIRLRSVPGRGTTFTVMLPASDRPTVVPRYEERRGETWRGQGTVLLVDDEKIVRRIGSEMLRSLGYEVITANDGLDALETFRRHRDIDFVILDLTMPHLDGEETFRELVALDPDVKVFISSGYSEHDVTERFAGATLAGFIPKPYLLTTLREILGALER
jgi:CheY-like chemotaxis protein